MGRVPGYGQGMGRAYEQVIWAEHMGRAYGQSIWAGNMGRAYEQDIWAEHMGSAYGQGLIYVVYHYSRDKWYTTYIKGRVYWLAREGREEWGMAWPSQGYT